MNYFGLGGWEALRGLLEATDSLKLLGVADVLADPAKGLPPQKQCRPDGPLDVGDLREASAALAAGLAVNKSLARLCLGRS